MPNLFRHPIRKVLDLLSYRLITILTPEINPNLI
jgi:hypothetical protein